MPTKIDFIGGNTKRCLMAMALPMIAAMFLNMMYNLVDSLWIGNLLGETAYAALTNSTPIILILTSVAMGATNGVSILISQAIGAKDKKKAESLIATSFCVAVTFSLLVTILLEIFLPGILKALNTPAETYDMAYSYLAIYILGGARYDRAKDYLKCALGYGCGLLVILSVLVVGFSKQLSGLFVRSSDVAVIVGTYFLIVSIGYVLNTVTNCYLGALNGMGKPSISMFLMIFYYIVVRMPLAYLLSYLGFGLNGIWVAVLVSHIVASLAATMTGTVLIRSVKSA